MNVILISVKALLRIDLRRTLPQAWRHFVARTATRGTSMQHTITRLADLISGRGRSLTAVVATGALCAGLVVFAGPAEAVTTNYYVDLNGSGTACTQLAPCATIDQALATASASSAKAIVNVGPGTFDESANLTVSSGTVTVAGIPGATVVDPASGGSATTGFENDGASLTLTGLHITGFATGVSASSGTTTVDHDTIDGGTTAVATTGGTVNVTSSTVTGSGTAVALAGGALTLDHSTVSGAGGNAVDAGSATLTVRNSTIAGNSGGIVGDGATVTLSFSTIAENSGTGLDTDNGQTTAFATIFAGNGTNCSSGAASTLLDNGFNVDDGSSCGLFTFQGSLVGVDPGLGGLDSNGGPTQTESLGAGSPARQIVPVASCTGTDQRGEARTPSGATFCDAGAYEYAGPTALKFASAPITGPTSAGANLGPITVEEVDAAGNPASTDSLVTVHLSSTTLNSSIAQTPGGSVTSAVSIPANTTSTSFFAGDSKPSALKLKATASGLTSVFQTETVITGPASSFTVGGGNQSAVTHHLFTTPLSAVVVDGTANPVSGAAVTFTYSTGPGTAVFAANATSVVVNTDATGTASAPLTAGAVTGDLSITVSVAGVVATQNLTETVLPGPAATVAVTSGDAQTATPHQAFSSPLQATVTDADGNVVPGATVTFTAPVNGAAKFGLSQTATAVTDTNGVATSSTLTAGAVAQAFTVTASVPGATSASFGETVTPGAAASVSITAGDGQSVQTHLTFPTGMSVRVADADGNAVPGASVTFTVSSAAGGTFPGGLTTAVVATGSNGVATAPTLTAGTAAGTFTVTAAVSGASTATFHETTLVGPRPTVTKVSPNSGPVGGGRVIVIQGTNLKTATSVHFGSATVTAAHFVVATTTLIEVYSPAHSAGVVDVTVSNPGGTSATGSADHFTYK
jgi:hypothetical protein